MVLSRSARITLLLVIDLFFFFVELVVGYAVGSLALVADSFHMLNDVMSLVVALYAIKLTAQTSVDTRYTYGWHRAEILAALVNGVFLVALCFSIALEALGRFFTAPEITNPKLVVIVGSLGLASNIVGLFLFHEHGHSHDHGHAPAKTASGRSTPEALQSATSAANGTAVLNPRKASMSRRRSDSYSSLYGHPAATRASLVHVAEEMAHARSPSPKRTIRRGTTRSVSHSRVSLDRSDSHGGRLSDVEDTSEPEHDHNHDHESRPTENTPLLVDGTGDAITASPVSTPSPNGAAAHGHGDERGNAHGGHSHGGSMNMRAVLLHVLGDALGNVGVIAAGLVIWLTDWRFRFLFDPVISLVITVIIFSSALPLVRSASFILLQGVPSTVSLEAVRESILEVPGVLSVHELHVWQLSETKIVASVHVTASRHHDFMIVAARIREELHHHGIHSSTIQPEYHHDQRIPEEHLIAKDDTSCLIACPPDQMCSPSENACCPPATTNV